MTKRNFENLYLLTSFRAIAEDGSVAGAARRLGLTQSAVSKHLARLRVWLGDPLFVRTSAGMKPTPRAMALAADVDGILSRLEALTAQPEPDPASFAGTFTLSSTDEVFCSLLPGLLPRLAEEAPDLRLTAIPLARTYSLPELEAGTVNLVIGVNWHAPDMLRQSKLFVDRFVVAMRRDNPLAGAPPDVKAYADARHLLVAPLGMNTGAIDALLAEQGLARRIVASVPTFSLIRPDLLGAHRIATLPERVARRLARAEGNIVLADLPFSAPPVVYHALWHPRYDLDPRLRWMRALVAETLTARSGL